MIQISTRLRFLFKKNVYKYSETEFIYLFIYLSIYLFKVDKFTKIQYTFKVNYPILQKKSSNLLIKTKEKEKKSKTGL